MKLKIYRFLRKITKTREGEAAPNWVYKIGCLMFGKPHKLGYAEYDVFTDIFTIHGKKFSGRCLEMLAKYNGKVFIESEGDSVRMTEIK